MISLDTVTEFVFKHLEGVKTSKNGSHFLARCPLCGDSHKSKSKRRFNLEYSESNGGMFHCFNCNASGSFLTLYSKLENLSISEAIKALKYYDSDAIIKKIKNGKTARIEVADVCEEDCSYIMADCISANEKTDGYVQTEYQKKLNEFIRSRKITCPVYVAYKGECQGRFIIPIYNEHNHIVYFQARSIDNSVLPKYMNPLISKNNVILNKHKFDRTKNIIVCEGLLDAMSVGNQGTSCLGREVNSNFIRELLPLTDKSIIVALDNDKSGIESMISIINEKNLSPNVRFFLFPYKYRKYKDINEFAIDNDINSVYRFISENSYSKIAAYTKIKTVKWILDVLK
jgi:DNA primase